MQIDLSKDIVLQSKYLYLQSAGSTGTDGSLEGIHLRWDFLDKLDKHLPNGADTRSSHSALRSINYNNQNDYVFIYRSKYDTTYPTEIDFKTMVPSIIIDSTKTLDNDVRLWIFTFSTKNESIYIRFRDVVKFDTITIDATTNPIGFLKEYGNSLIEVSVIPLSSSNKDEKLFFAAEFQLAGNGTNPLFRVETISKNHPYGDDVVSSRKVFDNALIDELSAPVYLAQEDDYLILQEEYSRLILEQEILDLLNNGSFEAGNLGFETEYITPYSQGAGQFQIVEDANTLRSEWHCLPATGQKFMAVDSSQTTNSIVWKQSNIVAEIDSKYQFTGKIATLNNDKPKILVTIKGENSDVLNSAEFESSDIQGEWIPFSLDCDSDTNSKITIEITAVYNDAIGNDFGLDDLKFYKLNYSCKAKVISENIKSVRFTTDDWHIQKISIETYENYIKGANSKNSWEQLGDFALSLNTTDVINNRLHKPNKVINGSWPKYRNGDTLNTANYEKRWDSIDNPQQCLKYAINQYLELSQNVLNIEAQATLQSDAIGSDNSGGSIKAKYLDILKILSMDYHVARMLGLGYIDDMVASNPETEYIYLAKYVTFEKKHLLSLFDTEFDHFYATCPTKKSQEKLPIIPSTPTLRYGLIQKRNTSEEIYLTDTNGYSSDGKSRFVNLFTADNEEDTTMGDFFIPSTEFFTIGKTSSVFVGLEYKSTTETLWRKSIIFDEANSEVGQLPYPVESDGYLYVHQEQEEGQHDYAVYGINWFSRISQLSGVLTTDETLFEIPNTLLPPINFKAQLIQKENPLIFTTSIEQTMLANLTGDKTLVRVTFDYTHSHDITFQFGKSVELFFRIDPPSSVSGEILTVTDQVNNSSQCVVTTKDFSIVTGPNTADVFKPYLASNQTSKFIGSLFTVNNKSFIIVDVIASTSITSGATFILQKNEETQLVSTNTVGSVVPSYETTKILTDPSLFIGEQFTVFENLASNDNWTFGTNTSPIALSTIIQLTDDSWLQETEEIVPNFWSDSTQKNIPGIKGVDPSYFEEVRGLSDTATITDMKSIDTNQSIGVYKVEFDTKILNLHPQNSESNPVNWYKGNLRVAKFLYANDINSLDINGPKKSLDVLSIDSSFGSKLVITVYDNTFDTQPIQTGSGISVNFYPGFKVYLYADTNSGLSDSNILPASGGVSKTTYLGARSVSLPLNSGKIYRSKMSIPSALIAIEDIPPLSPKIPMGGTYATRPDFYNKSTYTFSIEFQHEPFAIAFYRASERMLLEALYKPTTIETIKTSLEALGDDTFFTDRWMSLVNFDFQNNTFPTINGYAFPIPDIEKDKYGNILFEGGPASNNDTNFLERIKDALHAAFLPLSEQPLFYKYIKGSTYSPTNKKQTIRNISGDLLDPTDSEFDQAPMAKKMITGSRPVIQFTDFSLDGSAQNFYFYYGIELNNRMVFSEAGPIAGPIQLVNTSAPQPPKITNILTQVADEINGIDTAVAFTVSNYLPFEKITKFQIYRAYTAADSMSTRTMQMVKEIDLELEGLLNDSSITILDDFANDLYIPYGDPLFYKIVALRKVFYADVANNLITDYVQSLPSKLLLASIVDNTNPEAPELTFSSDAESGNPPTLLNATLSWDKVTHNATYHIYKMTESGNWNKLDSIKTNDLQIVYLIYDSLFKKDADDTVIYHRFKVDVENSSGLFNLEENAITI